MSDQHARTQSEEERIEAAALAALRPLGWRVPVTEGEVAPAEEQVDLSAVELPGILNDPQQVLNQEADDASSERTLKLVRSADVEPTLARAAREGKAIPPEVEERMRQDRALAEQQHWDEFHGEDDR